MCRMPAYAGPPIALGELVSAPTHSLLVQSYRPLEMTSGVVNADGWGTALHAEHMQLIAALLEGRLHRMPRPLPAAPEPMGVWEWTSSWFEPYPRFRPYPYDGYSTPWFGQTHRVLRGASWATAARLRRRTMRNWYEPGFREIPTGFRCAGEL